MARLKIMPCERKAIALLKEAGLTYRLENGSKHRKLFVEGKLVAVFSPGGGSSARKGDRQFPYVKAMIERLQRC